MPLSDVLNIAKLGLLANQGSLKVVSHNISNVNTPGYSKQNTRMGSIGAVTTGRPSGGQGVVITQVRRQVDILVEKRLSNSTSELGRLEARNRYLPFVEEAFNNMDNDGLTSRLENFFSAADQLSDNVTNTVGRVQLMGEAENVSRFVNDMYNSMTEVTLPIDNEITVTLDNMNKRLQSIRDINLDIIKQETTNTPPLDLLDQRQQLINELGDLIDVRTVEQNNGGVSLMTSSGKLLVDYTYAATFTRDQPMTDSGFMGIRIDDRAEDVTNLVFNGELKGLIELRDTVVHGNPTTNGGNGWLYRLNAFVGELRWQTNLVHSQTVGSKMHTGQTGVFQLGDTTDLGGDIYSTFIDQLVVDLNDSNYDGVPPDMNRVKNGTLTIAYGPDPDNLSVDTININPATMTIEDVRAALDGSPAFSAVYDSNRVKLTAQDTYYGVVSDTSGIMAALGIGAIFGGRNAMEMSTNQEMIADNRMVGIAHIVQADDGTYQFDDGNNQGALAMSNLRSLRVDPFSTGDTATFASHYGQIVGELGSLIMQDKNSTTSLEIQQEFITGVRESVSGVSLEEELTDLIKFQRAFQASGKMVGAADELMQSVLQML